MKISEFFPNQNGEAEEVKFSNGYTFKGELDPKNNPFYGNIFNSENSLIYHGQIVGDILGYFSEYEETGTIKQRSIL